MNNDLISRKALLENECCGRIASEDVRKAPAVAAAPAWISVEDRLPEDETEVLCWYRDENGEYYCTLGWYHRTNYGAGWTTDAEISGYFGCVTHWMPLPEPPEEDEHEAD